MLKQLIGSILQARRQRGFVAFAAGCRDVRATQDALLRKLVARNGKTALATRLGAAQIKRLEDLRKLPISDYEAIQPELQAALAGRSDQLVAGTPKFFGMTSGTTSRAKYIPIDEAYRAEFQRTVQHFLYGIVRDHPKALAHKVLYLVGPAALEITPGGATAGSISGHNLRRLPALIRGLYAVPADAFEIPDAGHQAYVVARFALASELSAAFAVTTAPLAIVGATMERHFDALLRDLHDGTLTVSGLASHLHAHLVAELRPAPQRARMLAARVAGKRPIPKHLFPDLKLLSCWHHASAGTHHAALRDLYGDVPLRPGIYSATEGWMNVPLEDAAPGRVPSGVLASDAVVLEFQNPSGTYFAHDIPAPGRYEILITSGAGLWRYRIGDEVEVTGFFEGVAGLGRAPMFHFTQKVDSVLSLAHDMTTEAHIRAAMTATFPNARRWVFGPSPTATDRYRVVLEDLAAPLSAEGLDSALRAANLGYNADRGDGLLQPLELVTRSAAAFDAWEASRRTAALSQAKPTLLVKSASELP